MADRISLAVALRQLGKAPLFEVGFRVTNETIRNLVSLARNGTQRGVCLLILTISGTYAGLYGQCTLQTPAWSGTSACAYSTPLNGVLQNGTIGTIQWTGAGAAYLNETDVTAPSFLPPSSVADQTYGFTITAFDGNGVECANSPLVLNLEVLATPVASLASTSIPTQSAAYDEYFGVSSTFTSCTGEAPLLVTFADGGTMATNPTTAEVAWGVAPPSSVLPLGWSGISHEYPLGFTAVSYTVTNQNGCTDTYQMGVYVGEPTPPEGPITSVTLPCWICADDTVHVPVTSGLDNPPGTLYLINVDDGSTTGTLLHPLPPVLDFYFGQTSCGHNTAVGHQNAFSITVDTYNGCGAGGTVNIAPIRLVDEPVAGFTFSDVDKRLCTTAPPLTVHNTSEGHEITCTVFNNLLATCVPLDTLYWEVDGPTGGATLLPGGVLGSDGGDPSDPSEWELGTNDLQFTFTLPGTYYFELFIGNACGISSRIDSICVAEPSSADFTLTPPSPACYVTDMVVSATDASTLNNTCSGVSYLYSATAQDICGTPASISLTDPGGGTTPNPSWDIGGPGLYNITLQLNDTVCPITYHSESITVQGPPSLTIVPADQTVCDVLSLAAMSVTPVSCDGSPATVTWEYQDETFTTILPIVTGTVFGPITDPVSGIIIITATSGTCPIPAIDTIEVSIASTPPSVNLAALDSSLCGSSVLTLTVDDIPSATYHWSGPGGFAEETTNDTLEIEPGWLPGDYTVYAAVGACSGTSSSVTIDQLLSPALTITGPLQLCPGVASVVLQASGADTYAWTDADGENLSAVADVTVQTPGGEATVIGTLANGCLDSLSVTVESVNTVPDILVTPDTACVDVVIDFTDQTTGATEWEWDFGDAPPNGTAAIETHAYTAAGDYTVTLTINATSDCPVDTSFAIVVTEPTDPSFALVDAVSCSGDLVCITNTSVAVSPTTYTWTIDSEPYATGFAPPCTTLTSGFGTDAEYVVELTTEVPGCPDGSFTDTFTIQPTPVATLGYSWPATSTTCSPLEVTFENLSLANWTVAFGLTDTIFFSEGTEVTPFENGSPVTLSFTAGNTPVTYTAILRTWNECGMDADTIQFTVQPPLVSAFFDAPGPVCAGVDLQFTSQAQGAQTWAWTFGDTTGSNAENPMHSYAGPDTYSVQLNVQGYCGSATWEDEVQVLQPPTASFTLDSDSLCEGTDLTVLTSTLAMTGYSWTFGDGDSSDLTLPVHQYLSDDEYPVTLTVTDAQLPACSHDTTVWVTVLPVPNDSIAVTHGGCDPDTVQFEVFAENSVSYLWDFGDDTPTATQQSPDHLYEGAGMYTATLTSTGPGGCTQVQYVPIAVGQTPLARITNEPVDPCGTPAMLVAAAGVNLAGTSVQWYLDGTFISNTAELATPVVTDGEHSLLLLNVLGGCSASDSIFFRTELLPIADFTVGPLACQGTNTDVVNTSANTLNYWWTWVGPDSVPQHQNGDISTIVFQTNGDYTVTLEVTGAGGCQATLSQFQAVSWLPAPVFGAQLAPECGRLVFSVPHAEDSTGIGYEWNFGGGAWVQGQPGPHDFADATGTRFNTCLRLSNDQGCVSEGCAPVFVEPCVWVPNSFSPNGDGINDAFIPVVRPLQYLVRWVVLDRWGEKLFTTTDPNRTWDGTYEGNPCMNDVYVWQATVLNADGIDEHYSGHVSIVR
jgi:gliding motility-associated-like protein